MTKKAEVEIKTTEPKDTPIPNMPLWEVLEKLAKMVWTVEGDNLLQRAQQAMKSGRPDQFIVNLLTSLGNLEHDEGNDDLVQFITGVEINMTQRKPDGKTLAEKALKDAPIMEVKEPAEQPALKTAKVEAKSVPEPEVEEERNFIVRRWRNLKAGWESA